MKLNYKKIIDEFIKQRYAYLIECSTNILKQNKSLSPEDLVSELCIYLYTNKEKVTTFINMNKLEAFAVSWMNIQGRYKTSPINKKYANNFDDINDFTEYGLDTTNFSDTIDKSDYENELALSFNDEQIVKILKIKNVKNLLSKSEQILYNAYFIENLSYDKIKIKYTFYRVIDGKRINYKSKNSIYQMMKIMKEKIKYYINDNN